MEYDFENLPLEEITKKITEGGEEGVKAFNQVIGALGHDFLATLSTLYFATKNEILNQMCMAFDSTDGDVYEIIVVRNRQSRLEQLGVSGDSMDMSSLFQGKSVGSPVSSDERSSGL